MIIIKISREGTPGGRSGGQGRWDTRAEAGTGRHLTYLHTPSPSGDLHSGLRMVVVDLAQTFSHTRPGVRGSVERAELCSDASGRAGKVGGEMARATDGDPRQEGRVLY